MIPLSVLPKQKGPAATGKTLPSPAHVIKSQERQFVKKEKRLWHREGVTKPNACQNRNALFAERNVPAAAGKTSPSLIHVRECQERPCCRKKRLRQLGRLAKPKACHKILGTSFLPNKKCLRRMTSTSLLHIEEIFVTCLWRSTTTHIVGVHIYIYIYTYMRI